MLDTLSTVIVSAVTSGLVALGIEWLAKPRLEARKERLLELHRKRQNFIDSLAFIRVCAGKWTSLRLSASVSIETEARLNEDREIEFQRIETLISEMNRDVVDIAFSFLTNRLKLAITNYIFVARAIQISDRDPMAKIALMNDITAPIHILVSGRWWQIAARIAALHDLETSLNELTSQKSIDDQPKKSM